MNVFTDFHHAGLLYSLHLLFEKRLGWNLFRPVGEEWFQKGYWKIAEPYNNNPNTIKQFLSLDQTFKPVDGSPVLNHITSVKESWYETEDTYHGYMTKAITFDQFKSMNIDLIIASIPSHWVAYKILRDKEKPRAKFICQMGNMFHEVFNMIENNQIENLMAATIPFDLTRKINHIFYHEEQPLIDWSGPSNQRVINSFVHLLPLRDEFEMYKSRLNEYEFHSYGSMCPNGALRSLNNLYEEVKNSAFIYHVKPGGDGYGWNWHTSFLVGRPIITHFSDYKDKLGGLLFENGVTGVDLEQHIVSENEAIIRHCSDPEIHFKMCSNARKKFVETVNYDSEYKEILKFLERMI